MHSLDTLLLKIACLNTCAVGLIAGITHSVAQAQMQLPEVAAPRIEVGRASWYGPGFDGRLAADGTVFNARNLTAAHRTLPLGTYARVTNLQNGNIVHVRITDRGPFIKGRVLDLSKAAAERLGMMRAGIAMVRIDATPSSHTN